jgi:5-oxoprolinase (ATP-hydrolysing)
MYHIRANAENSVRALLRNTVKRMGTNIINATDFLDDGSPVCFFFLIFLPSAALIDTKISLRIEINAKEGSAIFDFAGTGCEVRGNLNSPISVVHSAVIYCMRAMLDLDIPLNAGCLVPLDSMLHHSVHVGSCQTIYLVRIPVGSLLAPSRTAAVCGGNVLTSQRIVDVVLRAFNACAASQGCTNNLTFGAGGKDAKGNVAAGWGYYEVI